MKNPPTRKEIEIQGCTEVPPDTAMNEFIDPFLAWVESKGLSFGSFRKIIDGHYVNRDGSPGKHISEE